MPILIRPGKPSSLRLHLFTDFANVNLSYGSHAPHPAQIKNGNVSASTVIDAERIRQSGIS